MDGHTKIAIFSDFFRHFVNVREEHPRKRQPAQSGDKTLTEILPALPDEQNVLVNKTFPTTEIDRENAHISRLKDIKIKKTFPSDWENRK